MHVTENLYDCIFHSSATSILLHLFRNPMIRRFVVYCNFLLLVCFIVVIVFFVLFLLLFQLVNCKSLKKQKKKIKLVSLKSIEPPLRTVVRPTDESDVVTIR